MYDQPSDWMDDAHSFEFNPWEASRMRKKPRRRHRTNSTPNQFGDTVTRDANGRITAFRYSDHGAYYSFEYDKEGRLSSINRSDGWVWRRVDSSTFEGWNVRNYFESWKVEDADVGTIVLDENGIRATGKNADLMGLPERREASIA